MATSLEPLKLTRPSQLRNFANAARQLGSSVGILSSAFRLRERLGQILFLFRDNAADLFPRKVSRQQREFLVNPNLMDKKRKSQRRKNMPGRIPAHIEDTLDLESLPELFENFATALMTFLKCLNEFPEFTDEAVNTSIKSFEGDLKVGYKFILAMLLTNSDQYWACCLQDYRGKDSLFNGCDSKSHVIRTI